MEWEPVKRAKTSDEKLDKDVLNLYNNIPFGLLTLEECEDLFRQRLEAFALLEASPLSGQDLAKTGAGLRLIKSFAYKTNCIMTRVGDKAQQKQDHFSHMLMRMYCIYQSNLWPWFRQNEKRLFHYRLKDLVSSISGEKFQSILKAFNFKVERVVGSNLNQLTRENILCVEADKEIFKVKWTDALWLVGKRVVSLDGGYAYLTKYDLMQIACDAFEKYLDKQFLYGLQHLTDELLQTRQLLESLHLVYQDFLEKLAEERKSARRERSAENSPYQLDLDNIDEMIQKYYPPCMRYLHDSLITDSHLRHGGRLHYGAFLRSAGVSLENSIEFWRKEFTKKIPNEKFERAYLYNIRHLYGKEGHKKALSCFSCDKIINDSHPGPGDKHGCPFKHLDGDHFKNLLTKYGLDPEKDLEDILSLKREKDFKGACTAFYEKLKGKPLSDTIRSPMQFYYESRTRQLIETKGIEEGQANDIPAHTDPAEDWDDF